MDDRTTVMRRLAGIGIVLMGVSAAGIAGQWRNIGPDGGRVWTMAFAYSQPAVVVAGTDFGAFRSEDGGVTWMSAGLAGSFVYSVAVHPVDPNIILAASDRAIFRSVDGGATWGRATVDVIIGRVFDIAFAPSDPTVVYAATDNGVYSSADGGVTWQETPAFCEGYGRGLTTFVLPHPSNPRALYASGASVGMCKSPDGGATWTPLPGSGGAPWPARPVMDPDNPEVLFAINETGVVRSENGGQTWTQASTGIPLSGWGSIASLAWVPSNPPALLAVQSDGQVFRSVDRGATWAEIGPTPGGLWLYPSPSGRLLATGTVEGVLASADGGASWVPSSRGLTNVHVGAILDAGSDLLVGAGGLGIFSSQDRGTTWARGREGLPWQGGFEKPWFLPRQLLPSPWRPGRTLAVTTFGLFESSDLEHWDPLWQRDFVQGFAFQGGVDSRGVTILSQRSWHEGCGDLFTETAQGGAWASSWPPSQCLTGSLSGVAADPSQPRRVFVAQETQGVLRSDDGGATLQSCGAMVEPGYGVWINAISTGVVVGELWAFTEAGIFRSSDGCASWRPPSLGLGGDVYTALRYPGRPGLVFAGARDGVLVSHDGGDSWALLAGDRDVIQVQALVLSQDRRTLYAGTAGRGVFALDLGTMAPSVRRRLTRPAGPAAGAPREIRQSR
ncbi:MAG TPA: hypothetical protein PLS53_11670 [Thermoanaerobaculaceae bacterium]|nr:hypothetical protein [Thermoanaerobaculaceae bacterium]